MSISSAVTRKAGPYTSTGAIVALPFTFKVFQTSDVLVVQTDLSGVETTLALTTNYTVSLNADQNANPGGSVSLVSAAPAGYLITIGSQVAETQPMTLTNNGGFYATVINDAMDRVTILVQQLYEKLTRTLTLPFSAPSNTSTTLPFPTANNVIGWNSTATGLQNLSASALATVAAYGTANSDPFSGDGATTNFTLSANPGALNNLNVAVGGVVQRPTIDYTWVSGTTLTFTTAPPVGANNILVRYMLALPQGTMAATAVTASDDVNGSQYSDLQGALGTVDVKFANYTALRAYTGTRHASCRLTNAGIAGFFYQDPTDTTSGAVFTGSVAPIATPAAPTLGSAVAGALAATTYFVKITYISASGETVASAESSLLVAINNVLVVTSPAAQAGATGYNVYVSTTTNTETKQNASPINIGTNWTEPISGLISGAALPSSGTAGSLLTASAVTNGTITPGQAVNRPDTGATIGYTTALVTGAGGVGTYTLSASATVASMALTSDNGGTYIIDASGRRWKRFFSGSIDVEWFSTLFDGATDDTAAVNRAVLDLAVRSTTGGVIKFPSAKLAKINGPIYIPANIRLDLNGCALVGQGNTIGVMFETAYVNAGALVTNVGTAYQSHVVKSARIYNGYVYNVGKMCNFQNFNMGCKVYDIELYNARQVGDFDACFYAKFDTVYHSGGTDISLPAFHFKSANNNIKLTKVITTCVYDYLFEGGSSSVTFDECSTEGGTIGIKVLGDMYGLNIKGHYAEAVLTFLDLSGAGVVTFDVTGNFFHLVDVVLDDGGSTTAGPQISGRWDDTNSITGIGVAPNRGRMQISAQQNLAKYQVPSNSGFGLTTLPTNWITSSNTNIEFTSTASGASISDYRQKSKVPGTSLIAPYRVGDTGAVYTGAVLFCTVTIGATSTVDTKIAWQPNSLFAKFAFTAQDGNGSHVIYGDIFGANFKRHDADAMVMAISNNAGFLRISLTQTAPAFASITGSIQICG